MQGEEQTPSESRQQAQESGPQGYGLHFADVQTEAQGGQVRPGGHRTDVPPTLSCCLDEMLALHLVPHLIYSAECAWEGHAGASGSWDMGTTQVSSLQLLGTQFPGSCPTWKVAVLSR